MVIGTIIFAIIVIVLCITTLALEFYSNTISNWGNWGYKITTKYAIWDSKATCFIRETVYKRASTETAKNIMLVLVGICVANLESRFLLWGGTMLNWAGILITIAFLIVLMVILERLEKAAKIERDKHDKQLIIEYRKEIAEYTEGLKKRIEKDEHTELRKDSKLETCLRCGLQTLMYNNITKNMECLNKYCPDLKPSH